VEAGGGVNLNEIDLDSCPSPLKIGHTVRTQTGRLFTITQQAQIDEIERLRKIVASIDYDKDFRDSEYIPPPKLSLTREPDLVRAEFVDAMRDYAQVFREKAALEIRRAEAIEEMARKVEATGAAEQPDVLTSQEWERAYKLLEMRFHEMNMRVQRLMLEHGNN
jgi:hypothetical protein